MLRFYVQHGYTFVLKLNRIDIRTIHHKHLIFYELSFKTNRYLQNIRGKILNSYVGKTARLMDQYFKQIVGLFCRHPDDKKYRQTHDY